MGRNNGINLKHAPLKIEVCENQLEDLYNYLRPLDDKTRVSTLFSMFDFYKKYSGMVNMKLDLSVVPINVFADEIKYASKEQVLETKNKLVEEIVNMFDDNEIVNYMPIGHEEIKISSNDVITRLQYYCMLIKTCDVLLKD